MPAPYPKPPPSILRAGCGGSPGLGRWELLHCVGSRVAMAALCGCSWPRSESWGEGAWGGSCICGDRAGGVAPVLALPPAPGEEQGYGRVVAPSAGHSDQWFSPCLRPRALWAGAAPHETEPPPLPSVSDKNKTPPAGHSESVPHQQRAPAASTTELWLLALNNKLR